MNKPKHTPGPWTVTPDGIDGSCRRVLISADAMQPGRCGSANADARLIASAPDLLAALTLFMVQYDAPGREDRPEILAARAAIRKATGEGE